MRALRILLIVVVILGGLFVIADRVAVNYAEGEAADRLKATEHLETAPDVSIKGFPFLTQLAFGSLDEVQVGIEGYEAPTGQGVETIHIDDLRADMKGVEFAGGFGSATAASATGTATVAYDELLRAAKSSPTQVAPGVVAKVIELADGGNGKIKVTVEGSALGTRLEEPVSVLSSVTVVDGDTVRVTADAPPTFPGSKVAESRLRQITDFEQKIDALPGGISLDKVEAGENGVNITVKGSDVRLVG